MHPSKHLNIIIHSSLRITGSKKRKINNWVQRLGRWGREPFWAENAAEKCQRLDNRRHEKVFASKISTVVEPPHLHPLKHQISDLACSWCFIESIQSCLLKSRLLFELVIKASHFQSRFLRQNRIVNVARQHRLLLIGRFWLKLAILWSTHPWAFVSGWLGLALDVWTLRNFSI